MSNEFNILINTRLDTSSEALKDMTAQMGIIEGYLKSQGSIKLDTKLSDDLQQKLVEQVGQMKSALRDDPLSIRAQLDKNALLDIESAFKSFKTDILNTKLNLRAILSPEDKTKIKEDMKQVQELVNQLDIKPVEINLGLREGVTESLRANVKQLENELKDLNISIGVGIDEDAEKKVEAELKAMQDQIEAIKKSDHFDNISKSVQTAREATEKISGDFDNAKRSVDLLSEKLKTTGAGELLSTEKLRRTGLTETERTVTKYSDEGRSVTLETENDYIKAQKELYDSIKKLRREIVQIDNQAVKATEQERAALMAAKGEREELELQARANLETHGLVNQEIEREMAMARELSQIQLQIRQGKDLETQSRRAYKELEKEIRHEHQLQKRVTTENAEVSLVTQEQIRISKERQAVIEGQIAAEGLANTQKELELNQLLLKNEDDLYHAKKKSNVAEEIRIQKLNELIDKPDFATLDIRDVDAVKEYTREIAGATAEVTRYTPHVDAAGNQQVKMTVAVDTANNKLKEYRYVLDETSGGMYKLSESIKPNTARMVGFVGQMREAITKSITWGLSMELLYGNLRRLREGIVFIKELDKELTQVKIITGMTNDEVADLARGYADLGQEMGKTVAEISKVNTELIRQGLSAEESNKRMQTVMKLSATSGMETEQALQIATSSVNALGIEAEHTSDVLLKAGQISASSAGQIGEALTKMAASAKASNMSVEETTALISTLVEVTQESPSSLGNSLKTLMARFSQVNEETGEVNESLNDVQKAFESVGVEFTDAEGQIKPFYDLLSELSEVWEDLDKNTKSYVATQAAGKQNLMPAHTVMCA